MTKDISVERLIKCAEIHFDVDEECGGCDYKGCDIACVDALLADAITVIKVWYREACKVENSPADARKEAEPINVLAPIKSPSEGAFEVLWTEGGEGQKLRFTDMENATIFTDLLLNAKRNVGEVTIRRMAW